MKVYVVAVHRYSPKKGYRFPVAFPVGIFSDIKKAEAAAKAYRGYEYIIYEKKC
jgi:hypothetical protein